MSICMPMTATLRVEEELQPGHMVAHIRTDALAFVPPQIVDLDVQDLCRLEAETEVETVLFEPTHRALAFVGQVEADGLGRDEVCLGARADRAPNVDNV
jgi:hypothetical protein